MIAIARNIGDACSSMKAGKWERSRLVGIEMKGKTLGIVGMGKGMSDTLQVLQLPYDQNSS